MIPADVDDVLELPSVRSRYKRGESGAIQILKPDGTPDLQATPEKFFEAMRKERPRFFEPIKPGGSGLKTPDAPPSRQGDVKTISSDDQGALSASLEEIALYGRDYEGADAIAAGLVHEVLAGPEFETVCRDRLAELASRDTHALGLTKRYLRGPALERISREDPRRTAEFVDAWFRPATQDRIRAVVERLRRG